MRLYLAWRGGQPVGRIAATVDRLHNETHKDTLGFWGFFESENDPDIARALLDRAADDLRAHGMTHMMGPMNPSINGECGILVEGFDSPPVILMPYNPPHYESLILQAGLQKVKDLLAYLAVTSAVAEDREKMQRIERLCDAIHRRHPSLRIRTLDMKRYDADILELGRISNAARRNNWGFVPMTDDEIRSMAKEMKLVVDPEVVIIAELEGKPIACMITIPDINPILQKLNGRLLPFGWLRLLLRRRSMKCLRIFATAVPEEYRHLGPTPLLALEMIRRAQRRGYTHGELSWVAEGNLASIQTAEHVLNPRLYKRYRIYGRDL